ncbi:MAG: hypothetical protein WB689_15485 [Xanthobacteraceae bacterium]
MIENIGPNMFFFLRIYWMSEADLTEEIASDRDLVRQGFMNEDEFEERSGIRDQARKLHHRDVADVAVPGTRH